MIQIDDAGWGSLLLGCGIGGYRVETGEFVYREVPVELFQENNFASEKYQDGAVQAAQEVLKEIRHTHGEPIEICTGYVLESIRHYLASNGYSWKSGKIIGPLQEKIENRFLKSLTEIGFHIDYEMLTQKQGLFFYKALKWLKGENINGTVLPDRKRFAKTGWPTYHIWAAMPYEEAKVKAKKLKNDRRRLRNI